MNYGNTICFCALLIVCLILELKDIGADGLWVLVVIWAIYGDFDKKQSDSNMPKIEQNENNTIEVEKGERSK